MNHVWNEDEYNVIECEEPDELSLYKESREIGLSDSELSDIEVFAL